MDITAFIRELLFGHDCVIVPGFGGFIGNYTPSRIDKKTGTFYPPVKQISFNRNLNHNDGLLIGTISGARGINYGDARLLVEEFAADLRRRLDKGEKIVFDNIGSFINNQEGNIQFEPDRTSNYHLDSYGLESFQMMPLEGYDVRTRVTRHIRKDDARQVYMRKILWRAAVIVPLLSVLIAVPLKTDLFRAKVEASNMNPLVSAEFEHNRIEVDKTLLTDTLQTDVMPVKEETGSPSISEAPQPVITGGDTYYLITGSFRSEENAVAQVDVLRSQGFTPEIVVAPNGFFRVCAMICSDMSSALTRKDSIADQFPGAWISRKK